MEKPYSDPRIFWDVDFSELNFEVYASFVISRVFERGDVADIRNCRRYYGDEKISKVLLQVKYLPIHRIYLASAVIAQPLTEFRCYTERPSINQHSTY